LLLRETKWQAARSVLDSADHVATARLTYVEAHALIASARRAKRLSRAGLATAQASLERLWAEVEIVELGEGVAQRAAEAARRHALRAPDAVHLASALALGGDVVIATWDHELRRAASEAGLAVAPA